MTAELKQTDTGYLVTLPGADGVVCFHFENVEQFKAHQMEADLTTWQDISGLTPDPFSARINVLSLSNREAYRRQLDDAFGKGGWTNLLNRACQIVRVAVMDQDPSIRLGMAKNGLPPGYVYEPFISNVGASILFGKGGSGKTYLAVAWARQVALKGPAVLYVDYEADAGTLKHRCEQMGTVPAQLFYWPGQGSPLSEQVIALERKIRRDAIEMLVIDSAALACGGDAEKTEPTIRFFNALNRLGLPALIIAHVTKEEKDQYPFGSVFWHNSARVTWNLKASQEEDGAVLHIGLFNRKQNNDRLRRPVGCRLTIGEDVLLEPEDIGREFMQELSLSSRIRRVIGVRAKSIKEIADELEAKEDSVKRTLQRMNGIQRIPGEGRALLYGLSAGE